MNNQSNFLSKKFIIKEYLKKVIGSVFFAALFISASISTYASDWTLADVLRDSSSPNIQGTGTYTVSQTRPDVSAHVGWNSTKDSVAHETAHYTLHFLRTGNSQSHLKVDLTVSANGSISLGRNSQGDPIPLTETTNPRNEATYATSYESQFSAYYKYQDVLMQGSFAPKYSSDVSGNTDVGVYSYPISTSNNPIVESKAYLTIDSSGERFIPSLVDAFTFDSSSAGQGSSATAKAYLSVSVY